MVFLIVLGDISVSRGVWDWTRPKKGEDEEGKEKEESGEGRGKWWGGWIGDQLVQAGGGRVRQRVEDEKVDQKEVQRGGWGGGQRRGKGGVGAEKYILIIIFYLTIVFM